MARAIALLCAGLVVVAACRAGVPRADRAPGAGAGPVAVVPGPVARGGPLYAAYCAGCHGVDGRGHGPVARALGQKPADLTAPETLAPVSDRELGARVLYGTPSRSAARAATIAEDLQVAALVEYIPTLSTHDWALIRSGRLVYESACAPCHGAYGHGEGVFAGFTGMRPVDLQVARERYPDAALAQVSHRGVGAMPPLADSFEPGEVRALIAYVRLLSKGYRLYDTYCAACHGDDGWGVQPEDLLPPATQAPPLHSRTLARLGPEEQRARVLHMLRCERGLMPHFRDTLTPQQMQDIATYLRGLAR